MAISKRDDDRTAAKTGVRNERNRFLKTSATLKIYRARGKEGEEEKEQERNVGKNSVGIS